MNSCLARRVAPTPWSLLLCRRDGASPWKGSPRQQAGRYGTIKASPTEAKSIAKGLDSIHFSWGSDSHLSKTHRSLVRSALREASYLPDPNARQFVKARTLRKSRKLAFRQWEHRDDPDYATRVHNAIREAHKTLNKLRRANQGERSALLQVLYMTYGRIGIRRLELLRPLYRTEGESAPDLRDFLRTHQSTSEESAQDYDPLDGPEVEQEPDTSPDEMHQDSSKSTGDHLPALTPELYALAKSQKQANPPALTRKNPRHLKPSIPKTNARMLPMPRKRIKNMHKKWYADLLERILPPLPTNEWEQLRDWSRGANLPHMIIPRRLGPEQPQHNMHFGRYSALEAIVLQGRIDKAVYVNRELHEITPRFMQRLWATVFSMCPYMTFDDKNNNSIRWGHHELAAPMMKEVEEIMEENPMPNARSIRRSI